MHVARRMADIAPFHVMDLMARANALEAQGRTIIHMEVGEPDFPTPEPIVAAAQRFIGGGKVFYTNALGLPRLREAISGHYAARYGVDIDPARIVVTSGASAALLLALGVTVNPGDEILLADPGYPCNRHFVRAFEGRPCAIPVGPETDYQPTAQQVADQWSSSTRGLLVASPSNPTGTLLSRVQMAGLRQIVSDRGGHLFVDEIYHGLIYGGVAETALSISEDIFVINSFSKYFGMTGWRLGWLVVPEGLVREVEKLAQNFFIAPPTPAQHAALAAFDPETLAILEARRFEFMARRDVLLPGLKRLGFEITATPQGAFYIYAGLGQIGRDSYRLALDLVEHGGVAATPGLDFGDNSPERHMRFAYTVTREKLEEGLRRIERFLMAGA